LAKVVGSLHEPIFRSRSERATFANAWTYLAEKRGKKGGESNWIVVLQTGDLIGLAMQPWEHVTKAGFYYS